jgi:hypothetical protein
MDSFYSGIVEEQGFCGIGKTWQCILCDLAIKSEQERRNHSFNTGHRANVVETLELLGKKYDIGGGKMMLTRGTNALDLDSRADRLQSLNWKLQVQGVLYRFMKLDVVHSSTDTIYSLLGQAETLLQKFEQMERLSLLELAVWLESSLHFMRRASRSRRYEDIGRRHHVCGKQSSYLEAVSGRNAENKCH